MIREQYVSFETARLLKEKGFDAVCTKFYNLGLLTTLYYGCQKITREQVGEDEYLAPSQSLAMRWLREEKKCIIEIGVKDMNYSHFNGKCGWLYSIKRVSSTIDTKSVGGPYASYEEACEAAIKYCLENLI